MVGACRPYPDTGRAADLGNAPRLSSFTTNAVDIRYWSFGLILLLLLTVLMPWALGVDRSLAPLHRPFNV